MRSLRNAAALVLLVVLVAACGDGEDVTVEDATPQATVTVTETVTETATEVAPTEPATSEPTDAATSEDGAASGYDPCSAAGLEQMGFIFVTTPRPGEEVGTPFTAEGCSNTFEANVEWRLVGQDGQVISEGHTTATCGTGCVGTFSFDVAHPQAERRIAYLEVYETSPQDGSEGLLNSIPVILAP